jgi:hypothetical protein
MTKRRLAQYLIVGALAGLFVSACAGVTSGQIALPEAGDVLTAGPAVDMSFAQTFDIARPGHSAHFVFEKAAQPAVESLVQSQMEMQMYNFCSRAGH